MLSIFNKKGLTLVEIVVSLAILGIMTVTFLNLFLSSYFITNRAGSRDDSLSSISTEMEKELAGNGDLNLGIISTSSSIVTLQYNDIVREMDVTSISAIETNEKNQKVELKYSSPQSQ